MPKAHDNQHRWKMSLQPQHVTILEGAAEALKLAWGWDNKEPKSYPVNTDHALWETRLQLKDQSRERKRTKLQTPRPRAKSMHDLIDEEVVKRLYEQQHSGAYKQALTQASEGFGAGFVAWTKIVNCLPAAYLLDFGGPDMLPKPRVQFLHRELLEIAKSLELDQLIKEGLAEFLDDICPCEKKHNAEAIRKLGKRISKSRQH